MELTVGVGLLGCGTVGAAVAERLHCDRERLMRRSGVRYDLRAIGVRNPRKPRPATLPAALFTDDARALADDPAIDLLIECAGGTDAVGDLVERALDRRRHVVTANKALLGTQGPRLRALAAARGVALRFEAAVCGAIPVVRTLAAGLAGDDVTSIAGIVNGTCTAILAAMERRAPYARALAESQRRGFAECDPSDDVDGVDAAHKLALLVQLAFGLAVISPRIRRHGIADIPQRDVARATALGYRIRLVAAARRCARGVMAEVGPVLLADVHPFARTDGADNVARTRSRDAGVLLLAGSGAGGEATASAVLGDTVAALRAIGERRDLSHRVHRTLEPALDVLPLFDVFTRHPELPRYPLWDDARFDRAEVPAGVGALR